MLDWNASKRTVLILDPELAFAFWLGQTLVQAGYNAYPATHCEDAIKVLAQLKVGIDVLVVSFGLAGAREFAGRLRLSQSHLKVLAVMEDGEELSAMLPEADAAKNKPSPAADDSKIEWLRSIEGLLSPDVPSKIRKAPAG